MREELVSHLLLHFLGLAEGSGVLGDCVEEGGLDHFLFDYGHGLVVAAFDRHQFNIIIILQILNFITSYYRREKTASLPLVMVVVLLLIQQ